MVLALEIFNKLPGTWSISRTISNYATATINGKALFSIMPNENDFLHYREEGTLTLEQNTFTQNFFREYIYGRSQNNLTIYFNETPRRVYQVLDLKEKYECQAYHQCNNDLYKGIYDFKEIEKGKFKITYIVTGPKKGYVIVTQFTREIK